MASEASRQAAAKNRSLGILPVCLAAGGLFAAGTARVFLVPFHARSAGASTAEVGLLFAVMQLSAAAASIPAGAAGDRFGRRRVLLAAALLMTGSQLVISRTQAFPLELCMQALQ